MQIKQDIVFLFENFMAKTIQGLNTYRVKRETTFESFRTNIKSYLETEYVAGNLGGYDVNIKQSGKKAMGMYVVGAVTLTVNNETFDLPIKLKMNGWKESKVVIEANKLINNSTTCADPAASVEEVTS